MVQTEELVKYENLIEAGHKCGWTIELWECGGMYSVVIYEFCGRGTSRPRVCLETDDLRAAEICYSSQRDAHTGLKD